VIEAEVTDAIMIGTISIPHGWGHHGKGLKLKRAERNAGVNINELMSHTRLDSLSYNAAFNGQSVGIRQIDKTNHA